MTRRMLSGLAIVSVCTALMLTAGATAGAQSGTPLPAGGGDPGKAYLACQEEIRQGNFDGMVACMSAERAAEMAQADPAEAQEMFGFLQMMQATDMKVLGGSLDGDTATLNVEGMQDTEKVTATVTMVREDGAWKIERESWTSGS